MRWLVALALLVSTARADDLAVSRGLADRGTTGFAQATTEYTDRLHFDLSAEALLIGPVRFVAGVSIGEQARPGAGVGVDVMRGGTAYLRYKAEGFSEPEGEIEGMFVMARALGAFRLTGAIAYGQDPEGNERDGELAGTAQHEVVRDLYTGLTARYRDALGSTKQAIVRDALVGAATTWMVGRVAIGGAVGVAMVETRDMPRRWGPGATLAVGTAF